MGKPCPQKGCHSCPVCFCKQTVNDDRGWGGRGEWESHLMKAQFLEQFNSKKSQSLSGCYGPAQPGSHTLFPPPPSGPILTPLVREGNLQLPGSLSSSGTLLSPSPRVCAQKPDCLGSLLGSALTPWVMLHRLLNLLYFSPL